VQRPNLLRSGRHAPSSSLSGASSRNGRRDSSCQPPWALLHSRFVPRHAHRQDRGIRYLPVTRSPSAVTPQ
jgi:hypothetical protein